MKLLSTPTIQYCEKPIAGLIKRPFYAFSNIAFPIVGFFILIKGKNRRLAKLFGYTAIAIGLLSFFYDASYLYISQLFDLAGMLLFVSILLLLNLEKLTKKTHYLLLGLSILFILSITAILLLQGFAGNFVFGAYVLSVMITEYLTFQKKLNKNYKYWLVAFSLFFLGFIIWMLDASKTICFTFGLLNGRAIFHYTNAFTIYFLFKFYELNSPSLD